MNDLTELFCNIDDFWKTFKIEWDQHLLSSGHKKRGPSPELSMPEMMTIIIQFHQSNFRTFKSFDQYVSNHLKSYFPKLISYSRFIQLQKNLFISLFAYLLKKQRGHYRNCFYRCHINKSLSQQTDL